MRSFRCVESGFAAVHRTGLLATTGLWPVLVHCTLVLNLAFERALS